RRRHTRSKRDWSSDVCSSDLGVPSVVFTVPKLAMAGMSEQQAKESGKNIDVHDMDVSGFFNYKHTNEPAAAVKIIIDQDSDQIRSEERRVGKERRYRKR